MGFCHDNPPVGPSEAIYHGFLSLHLLRVSSHCSALNAWGVVTIYPTMNSTLYYHVYNRVKAVNRCTSIWLMHILLYMYCVVFHCTSVARCQDYFSNFYYHNQLQSIQYITEHVWCWIHTYMGIIFTFFILRDAVQFHCQWFPPSTYSQWLFTYLHFFSIYREI